MIVGPPEDCTRRRRGLRHLAVLVVLLISGACFSSAYVAPRPEPGRAEIWASTCSRCHRMRSPASLSDEEWGLVVHHMRVRAYLTAEEQQRILEFLEQAN